MDARRTPEENKAGGKIVVVLVPYYSRSVSYLELITSSPYVASLSSLGDHIPIPENQGLPVIMVVLLLVYILTSPKYY